MSLELGQVIDAKYRVVRLIGEGGMGTVYEGENSRIGRRVAIKVLHAQVASLPEFVERFEREARAAARIGSPHVCDVLDLGDLPNGDRYIVMEYLDGVSLEDRIAQRGKLTTSQVAPIAFELLEGLGTMHSARVIHRDLKPANVFLSRTAGGRGEVVKILDFGVAKLLPLAGEVGTMTRTGMMMGTPLYMSPEQARGARDVDGRTDIYAASVMFYRALTGMLPYNAETLNELLFKIVLEDPKPIREVAPEVDEVFAAIVHKGLARDLTQRFATAREYQEAIAAWGKAQGRTSLSFAVTIPSEPPALPQSAPAIPAAAPVVAAAVTAVTASNAGTPIAWSGSPGGEGEAISRAAETVLTPTSPTGPSKLSSSEPGATAGTAAPVAAQVAHGAPVTASTGPAGIASAPNITLASPSGAPSGSMRTAEPLAALAQSGGAGTSPTASAPPASRSNRGVIAAVAGAAAVLAVGAFFAFGRGGSPASAPPPPVGMTPVAEPSASTAATVASPEVPTAPATPPQSETPAPVASTEAAAPTATAPAPPVRVGPTTPRHPPAVTTAPFARPITTTTGGGGTAPTTATTTPPVAATSAPTSTASPTAKPAASARKFRTNLD